MFRSYRNQSIANQLAGFHMGGSSVDTGLIKEASVANSYLDALLVAVLSFIESSSNNYFLLFRPTTFVHGLAVELFHKRAPS